MTNLLQRSFTYSIWLQLFTGVIAFSGFFKTLNGIDMVLRDVLGIEAISQFIELGFYIYIYFQFRKMKNITLFRYLDWVLSTPVMLISTILYFQYLTEKENQNDQNDKNDQMTSLSILKSNKISVILMLLFNWLMLLCGYIGESNKQQIYLYSGFLFFVLSFWIVYSFAKNTNEGIYLFYIMTTIWFSYGIAAFFNYKTKNILYNVLDLMAKNFYGLYLFYKIQNL